ncbi:MAG: ATP-binding cassette domain-containing protein, partial [Planctomycetota bacterium]
MNAIEVEELLKDYGDIRAVDHVSFTVRRGEFFALLGPNGAGKSTILNILAGLTRPSGGTARVMGHDVVRNFRASRRNLGVVPQELVFESFFPVAT